MTKYDQYGQPIEVEKQSLGTKLSRIFGISSSLIVVGGLAWWAYNLGSRDASTVPVVKSILDEGEPYRTEPEDEGGAQVDFQGNQVNSVLEGEPPSLPNQVELAPVEEGLDEVEPAETTTQIVDLSPDPEPASGEEGENTSGFSTDVANIPAVDAPAKRPELLYIPPQSELNSQTAEARPIGESTTAASVPANNATELVENTQSEASSEPEPESQSDDLGPRLPSGTPLIQLAANTTIDETRAEWEKLRALHADLLGDKQLYVEKKTVNGTLYYRLRVSGFDSGDAAKSACDALLERGVQCITVRSE